MGTDLRPFYILKVLLSTLAFAAFELPPNGAIGTKVLQFLFNSKPDLVRNILEPIANLRVSPQMHRLLSLTKMFLTSANSVVYSTVFNT
jgi:hypothetical protein